MKLAIIILLAVAIVAIDDSHLSFAEKIFISDAIEEDARALFG